MAKKVVILTLVVFFAIGAVAVIAGGDSSCKGKNALQSVYNWFGSWDKVCVNKDARLCKACDKKCCADCNMDCGGTCCPNCCKK